MLSIKTLIFVCDYIDIAWARLVIVMPVLSLIPVFFCMLRSLCKYVEYPVLF